MGWSHTHMWQLKVRRDIMTAKDPEDEGPSSTLYSPVQGFSARKRSPPNFGL